MRQAPQKALHALVLVGMPLAFFGIAETAAQVDHRLRHGYTYIESLAYVPHPNLVFQLNPKYHDWWGRTASLPILNVSALTTDGDRRPRLWVLGGSTSAPNPSQTDWPAVVQRRLSALRVVNMAHIGYGTSQMTWLYRTYDRSVSPAAVVLFEGWNLRGAASSPYGWHPENTISTFSTFPQRVSADLMNWSAFYGRLWHAVDLLRPVPCRPPSVSQEELSAWAKEYENLVREISRTHPVYLVLFPGLAMRDDAREALPGNLSCVFAKWPAQRVLYEQRVVAIRDIASRQRVQLLDAAQPYQALSARTHVSYFRDFAHQTIYGNQFLGNAIANALLELGFEKSEELPNDERQRATLAQAIGEARR